MPSRISSGFDHQKLVLKRWKLSAEKSHEIKPSCQISTVRCSKIALNKKELIAAKAMQQNLLCEEGRRLMQQNINKHTENWNAQTLKLKVREFKMFLKKGLVCWQQRPVFLYLWGFQKGDEESKDQQWSL